MRFQQTISLLAALLLSAPLLADSVTNYGPISNSASKQIRPGQFVWADLITNDVPAAADFYNKVFGWDIKFNSDRSLYGMIGSCANEVNDELLKVDHRANCCRLSKVRYRDR